MSELKPWKNSFFDLKERLQYAELEIERLNGVVLNLHDKCDIANDLAKSNGLKLLDLQQQIQKGPTAYMLCGHYEGLCLFTKDKKDAKRLASQDKTVRTTLLYALKEPL